MDLDDTINTSYAAFDAFSKGDPAPVKLLFSRRDDVMLANPFGPAVAGWSAASEMLDFASSRYDSIRGPIESHWERKDGKLTIACTIPPNTTATVYVPTNDAVKVMAGDVALKQSGLKVLESKDGATPVEVGSGKYTFVVSQ